MSIELVNSVAAIGTFLVIGATAIAAIVQLRHLRASNQLQGLLTVLARIEDARFSQWSDGSRRVIAERMPDPVYRQSIVDNTVERDKNPCFNLANSYEWVGSLIRQGLIDEDAFMDVYSARVIASWQLLEEVTALRRRPGDTTLWENFEYLFVRARIYEKRHPAGSYPTNTPRAQLVDKWLAVDGAGG